MVKRIIDRVVVRVGCDFFRIIIDKNIVINGIYFFRILYMVIFMWFRVFKFKIELIL